jgi:hypothetical protein
MAYILEGIAKVATPRTLQIYSRKVSMIWVLCNDKVQILIFDDPAEQERSQCP